MSGENQLMESLRALKAAETGGLNGAYGLGNIQGGKAPDPKTIAFQTQMRMAQEALNAGMFSDGERPANSALGMEGSMLNDALLMDALSTISRLTGDGLPARPATVAVQSPEKAMTRNPTAEGLGSIAALFESGEKGAAAIGFDRTGGTSYGKFQLSSRAGTMNRFINFLAERAPDLASRLKSAGPANTGSTHGRMPAEWASIASESPDRFEALQTEFIRKDHYQPAREKIREQTGVDIETAKPALREALFSTAVQHGASGAARIFGEAIDKVLGKPGAPQAAGAKSIEQAVVSAVYDKRQTQFGGSTAAVRASVRERLRHEKQMVLAMLDRSPMDKVV
jgi:hypothetical protein